MARTKSSRPSARDRILATASALFYQEGVQNVGIDRIIAESGVAKMSLYNNFKSKDALIAAYLEQRNQTWAAGFKEAVEQQAESPRDRLLAVFDVLQEWFKQEDFRGCAFVNSAVELANPEHPAAQVARRHRQVVFDYILSLVQATKLQNPEELAQQLSILIDGATTVAMMSQNPETALQARQAASILLAHAAGE